jgi:hypothetical protein
MRSLKSQILTLWCRGYDYGQIVEALGVRREYVRVCIARAKGGNRTTADRASDRRQVERYRADPAYREKRLEYMRAYWHRKQALKRLAPRSGGGAGR